MEEINIGWNFDNSYARLPNVFFSRVNPEIVPSPEIAVTNHDLAISLGLNPYNLQSKEGAYILSGNKTPKGALPIAQAYAGHQFGHFTMLGDGRAVLIGEQITPKGERFDIQLKGSGKTPYSRGGDGKAALGPMLREYIISEAMHALGIPTTRSLAVVTTGETIIRQTKQMGAVLTRVASS
ncbi:protein adenylyltransferase SelO family protein, partial [Alkalithermobacter paradoxus]|uniref:protein adenylyltransferase SelO family protein n=1 Tax=Alkalithermobacter paradoxus TaxID=29349 RepID=UPI002F90E4E2